MVDSFLLGAGFSIAAAPTWMRDTDGLGKEILDLLKAIHAAPPRTHSGVCDGLSCDEPRLRPDGSIPAANFESWLTTLAEGQPFRYEPERLRDEALFRDIASQIAMTVKFWADQAFEFDGPIGWLADLLGYWHQTKASVATLNYDTLVEGALEALQLPTAGTPPIVGYRDILPVPLPLPVDRLPWSPRDISFKYMKLHGSVHWYWDETTRSAESMLDVGLPGKWRPEPPTIPDCSADVIGRRPVIVPPTSSKTTFFTNEVVRRVWRLAYEGIRRSDRVVIIGYSFPSQDSLVTAMLNAAISVGRIADITIVNPDAAVCGRAHEQLGIAPTHHVNVQDFVATLPGTSA